MSQDFIEYNGLRTGWVQYEEVPSLDNPKEGPVTTQVERHTETPRRSCVIPLLLLFLLLAACGIFITITEALGFTNLG